MPLLPDLSQRNLQPEVMDQPGLDPTEHRWALAGLARLNRWSRSDDILWRPVYTLAQQTPTRALRILDVASGAGDVALRLYQRARRAGVSLDITGVDVSPLAVEHARQQAALARAPIDFKVRDVLREPLPGGSDVVLSSLFLHHLAEPDAERLLRSMAQAAGRLALVNDLRRSRPGYVLAQVACRVLTRSAVVHMDGPRSVAGAFTIAEIAGLCSRAGLHDYRIERRWPSRFLLTITPRP